MLGNASTFHIVNLGCKVNRVEADSMSAALIAHGLAPVVEEAADFIIVNTCTVTAEADKKARKAVRHALATNVVAEVVVTGCAAAIASEAFMSMDPRVRVVGKAEIEQLLASDTCAGRLRMGEGFRTRVGLKVQDGCDHACTYCIVHVARGPARSIPAEQAVREARAYFGAGVKEIVLAGIDIGAYHDGAMGLPQLIGRMLEEADRACVAGEAPARIRISSIEPKNVDDRLIELMAASGGRVCRHLHMPLQSGCSKVLREMDRPYDAEYYENLVGKLRSAMPGIALSTDVIVGFPGETDSEFQETCDLVARCGFSRLHVFPYSLRKGTPAAARNDQVPPEAKRSRAAKLRELGRELGAADFARRAGTEELVLVEGATALTESYHEVPAPEGAENGSLVAYAIPSENPLQVKSIGYNGAHDYED